MAGQPYTTEVGVRSSSRLPSAIVPGGPRDRVRTAAPEVSRSSWRDTKKTDGAREGFKKKHIYLSSSLSSSSSPSSSGYIRDGGFEVLIAGVPSGADLGGGSSTHRGV